MKHASRIRTLAAATIAAAAAVGMPAAAAHAQDGTTAASPRRSGFGIGIGSGTIASGLSLKIPRGAHAFQVVAGFWGGGDLDERFDSPNGVAASFDFLFEMPTLARSAYFTIDWSFGLGGGVGVPEFDRKLGLAGAGVAGLEFNFTRVPLDLTVEYRPTLEILPEPDLHLVSFTAHLRFWL